jgi:hypothetical protein
MSSVALGSELLKAWGALNDTIDAIWQWSAKDEAEHRKLVEEAIAGKSKADADKVKGLLGGGSKSAEQIYSDAHDARRRGLAPDFTGVKSIGTFKAVHALDAQKCGETAGNVIGEVVAKGGLGKADPSMKRADPALKKMQAAITPLSLASGPPIRDMTPDPDGRVVGDSVQYGGLGGAVATMKSALDDGFILHARVLSGVGSDTPTPKNLEEHSIAIIGYDGDVFIFWDPDSGASSAFGAGFGRLTFDGKRITTAKDSGEFRVTNPHGTQSNGDHRYQLLNVYVK